MDRNKEHLGPVRNILLATDGSAYSEGAVKEAIYLARTCPARLAALYVLEVNPEFATEGLTYVEKMELDARRHLDFVRAKAAADNVECEVLTRRTDEPYRAIVEEAERRGCDVIVISRRGKTGLKKILMGSVTAKVIGYAHCNVLVVPKDAAIDCRRVLLAIDGSRFSEAAAEKALEIARTCSSRLDVISVVPADLQAALEPDTGYTPQQLDRLSRDIISSLKQQVKKVTDAAAGQGIHAEGSVPGGSPYEVIVETAVKRMSDLVVVGSHGRTGIQRLIMGSVAERVVALSPAAVLVVKRAGG